MFIGRGPINGHGPTPTPSVQSCPGSRTSTWESFHGEGGFSPENRPRFGSMEGFKRSTDGTSRCQMDRWASSKNVAI
ncbi:hypothetical protein M752DRAFT_274296 [Aspergillus phoenicis ATCC 13157]|uniref:Uncharacterized protein n=1 Tax=Aspergillus phoenicis ATCC 13157 TaxID=1353007 RepID=A0A370PS46_ASPPH|nr:hypothetical protein M752DRAFT_274296 [Aspergillus phoenicis ATCC 13157]